MQACSFEEGEVCWLEGSPDCLVLLEGEDVGGELGGGAVGGEAGPGVEQPECPLHHSINVVEGKAGYVILTVKEHTVSYGCEDAEAGGGVGPGQGRTQDKENEQLPTGWVSHGWARKEGAGPGCLRHQLLHVRAHLHI